MMIFIIKIIIYKRRDIIDKLEQIKYEIVHSNNTIEIIIAEVENFIIWNIKWV